MAVNDNRSAIHVPGCAPIGTRRALQQLAMAIPAIDPESHFAYTNPLFSFINGDQMGQSPGSHDTYVPAMALVPIKLTAGMSSGSAAGQPYRYNGSAYAASGGSFTVYDPHTMVPWACKNDIVFCITDGARGFLVAHSCSRRPWFFGTLSADWDGGTTTDYSASDGSHPIDDSGNKVSIDDDDAITTDWKLPSGAKILVMFDNATGDPHWRLVQAFSCEVPV